MLNAGLIIAGIVLLTVGGEALIRGALGVARRLGVSALLSGLVIVGFGTSMPEMAVTVDAALSQKPDIALGNVVGSNIVNVALILGVTALIVPLTVRPMALRRDALTVLAASVLFLLLAVGGTIGRLDALLLLLALAAYLAWAWRSERGLDTPAAGVHAAEGGEKAVVPQSPLMAGVLVIAGLGLLIAGSRVLLIGAVGLATTLGIPEAVIGLTLVAAGTSLPELSVSVIAAWRRHGDVVVGNILGSNIFNLLGILGVSALLQPLPLHARMSGFDQWVMLAAAVVMAVFLFTRRQVSRIEGMVLLAGYLAYLVAGFVFFGG